MNIIKYLKQSKHGCNSISCSDCKYEVKSFPIGKCMDLNENRRYKLLKKRIKNVK